MLYDCSSSKPNQLEDKKHQELSNQLDKFLTDDILNTITKNNLYFLQ